MINFILKAMALLALIAIGIVVYFSCSGSAGCACQPIDKTLPDISAAPYKITTMTYFYYAAAATENEDGSVTMSGWYERVNGGWRFHDNEITLPPVLRPKVTRR